jgi:hypothetical protein
VRSSALLADGNCSRLARPVFCSMLLTWDSTVLAEMNRRWEMSALLSPALTSRRISVSRAVSPSLARCGGTADVEPYGTLAPIDARVWRTRRCRARSPAALQKASASLSQASAAATTPAW